MVERYDFYRTNKDFSKKLAEVEGRMDKDRKNKKTTELRINEDLKRKELQKEIFEKENDFIILPRRRAVERFKPLKRKKRKSEEILALDDEEFDKFISYGMDDTLNL